MYMYHRPELPFSYFDKSSGKIILKLVCGGEITEVDLIYGDPFVYRKTESDKWEWQYSTAPLARLYIGVDTVMWQIELTPLATRRLKYGFVARTAAGDAAYYSENGLMKMAGLNLDSEKCCPPQGVAFDDSVKTLPHNHFHFPFAHDVDALRVPEWAAETLWYQIFPERFCNGDPSISPKNTEDWQSGTPKPKSFFGGDLSGIIQKLPYLQELGVTGLYLTPVFLAPSNHKYDTEDYFKVDPHFGDKETLKELVSKAHGLGMKVMLDAVFNHIGGKHAFWRDVLAKQEKSKYKDYFHIKSFPVSEKFLNYDTFAFAAQMPKWNTENAEARKYLIDAAVYWIKECDIDGWRLDVADEVSFSFWRDLKRAIAEVKDDVYVLGEIWHDPSKWLNGGYFDAAMNYPLGRAIRDLFLTKKTGVDAFNKRLFNLLMHFSDPHSRIQFNLLDSHDTARALTLAGGDKLALKNAFMFMLFMKGAPCIYYGTEVGMEGREDPDCRKPMVWKGQDKELLAFFKSLIALRKKYNNLVQTAAVSYERDTGLCRWKLRSGAGELTLAYNSGKENINCDILLSASGDTDMLPPGAVAVLR